MAAPQTLQIELWDLSSGSYELAISRLSYVEIHGTVGWFVIVKEEKLWKPSLRRSGILALERQQGSRASRSFSTLYRLEPCINLGFRPFFQHDSASLPRLVAASDSHWIIEFQQQDEETDSTEVPRSLGSLARWSRTFTRPVWKSSGSRKEDDPLGDVGLQSK
ncbi:hypothetical protein C8R44DRAFT_731467 [Mycena epipterygia]|nr:hypothetical protein C8R44DRAFT_731467 [Mycena epipterygia]